MLSTQPDPLPPITHCINTYTYTYSHKEGGGGGEPVIRLEGHQFTGEFENTNKADYISSL